MEWADELNRDIAVMSPPFRLKHKLKTKQNMLKGYNENSLETEKSTAYSISVGRTSETKSVCHPELDKELNEVSMSPQPQGVNTIDLVTMW